MAGNALISSGRERLTNTRAGIVPCWPDKHGQNDGCDTWRCHINLNLQRASQTRWWLSPSCICLLSTKCNNTLSPSVYIHRVRIYKLTSLMGFRSILFVVASNEWQINFSQFAVLWFKSKNCLQAKMRIKIYFRAKPIEIAYPQSKSPNRRRIEIFSLYKKIEKSFPQLCK